MDKIEKFILQNRAKLDVLEPSEKCNNRFQEILNDPLEKEIIQIRSSLNNLSPSDKVWKRIESELDFSSANTQPTNFPSGSIDKYDAPKGLWDKIENALDEEDQKNTPEEIKPQAKEVKLTFSKQWVSIAAMLILGVGIGWFGKGNLSTETTVPQSKEKTEWQQAEDYYMTMISSKKMQINALDFEDIRLLDDFNVQLKSLQKSYKSLKKEADKSAEPEIVRKQMVINLELQIELLNKQMEIIINSTKPERNHEEQIQYSI